MAKLTRLKSKITTATLCLFTSLTATAQTWQIQPVDEPNALTLLAIGVGLLILLKSKNKK